MENLKSVLGITLVIVIGWHVKVGFSSNTKLTGLFKEKPEVGYTWRNTEENGERFFWEDTNVVWQVGYIHPSYNVQASNLEGNWVPLAGYIFTNEINGDLTTVWKSGLKHPSMNAYSTDNEGRWIPALGYKFVMEDEVAVNTIWDAGRQYDNFKIIAGEEQDIYYPYAGYRFIDPKTSLEVVWTPGLTNPNNTELIAGITEGTWEYKNSGNDSYEPTSEDHFGNAIAGGLTGKVIEWFFGENEVSDKLYQESTKEGIRGVIKSIK